MMGLKKANEHIDRLIKNALMEEQGDCEVADKVKERIDQKIREETEKLKNSHFTH